MQDQVIATPTSHKRVPWNKGKLTGAKPPLRPKHVWSIRTKLQIEGRVGDLAMFNLAIDSKLRGCGRRRYPGRGCRRRRLHGGSRNRQRGSRRFASRLIEGVGHLIDRRLADALGVNDGVLQDPASF